jgi:hypothetical protein
MLRVVHVASAINAVNGIARINASLDISPMVYILVLLGLTLKPLFIEIKSGVIMSALQGVGQIPCSLGRLIAIVLIIAVIDVLAALFSGYSWLIPILLFGLNLVITMLILTATNARSNYIVSCYDQLLLFYLFFAIITLTLFIFISLYRLLYGLGGEVLRFYLTLLPVVITSLSIMFAVSFWVVNRVEGIAEDIGDDRLVRTTQNIKMIIVYAYVFSIFLIFGPLLMLPNPISTSALVSINLSLSYPLGMIAGIIQTLIVLDIVAVTLRGRLRGQRQ